ncbi:MAG TPA: efflux RND transporter periplasmic adaptor subunit [Thermoanaerobaculia bacterium]|nr:efflux RND transporter periplasmic adaptor subunit [Thermoanaerobaculia bacterium]
MRISMFQQSVVAAAALVVFAACGGDSSSAAADEGRGDKRAEAPKTVQTDRVQERMLGASVLVNGTLDAYERATVGTKVAGRLPAMTVDLGSRVSRGQLVARVDPTDYNIRLQQAEAGLAQARGRLGLPAEGSSDSVDPNDTPPVREARAVLEEARASRERYAALLRDGVISKADFDQVQAQARVAESRSQDAFEEIRNRQAVATQRRAEVALARQQLADTAIYAAFDGVVQQRIASLGEFLAAGAPVVEIVKVNPLRFRAQVPERDAASIRPGQNIQLAIDGNTRQASGIITRLSPTITERTRILEIEADIPNDGSLRAGSFARATIVTDTSAASLAIPHEALVTFAGIEKVVLVQEGKTKEKPVTTGRRTAQWVEVLDGVKAGDEVVLNPVNLRPGQAVRTQ